MQFTQSGSLTTVVHYNVIYHWSTVLFELFNIPKGESRLVENTLPLLGSYFRKRIARKCIGVIRTSTFNWKMEKPCSYFYRFSFVSPYDWTSVRSMKTAHLWFDAPVSLDGHYCVSREQLTFPGRSFNHELNWFIR